MQFSFWHELNAVFADVFKTEGGECLAPLGQEKQLLLDRIRRRDQIGFYPAYPSNLSIREVDIVCDNQQVAFFVQTQLRQMGNSFMPGDPDITGVMDRIELTTNEDDLAMIRIPFDPLIFLVRASQEMPGFLDIPLNLYGAPRGRCSLVEQVLEYNDGVLRVISAFSRLQVSNEPGRTNMIEVDLTDRLVALFDGGGMNRGAIGAEVQPFVSEYARLVRMTAEEILPIISSRIPALAIGQGGAAAAPGDDAEIESPSSSSEAETDEFDADEARRRARGGVWMRGSWGAISRGRGASSRGRARGVSRRAEHITAGSPRAHPYQRPPERSSSDTPVITAEEFDVWRGE